ncbi:MAG: hypothetical protein IKA40_00300, partial [Clostridia bacterium]|nr:hypothetical protein [Clostridia bacterium]
HVLLGTLVRVALSFSVLKPNNIAWHEFVWLTHVLLGTLVRVLTWLGSKTKQYRLARICVPRTYYLVRSFASPCLSRF